ncbi:MAG: NUDIX domain-containing protein [Candidatus Colwellbacteria bacterium]|nr:NUDIX domain-containing protein [Candidatus Colwellbacteria bacterium]
MADLRRLNIVDESGKIISEDTRENIHNKGLLHREIHVWFYTPRDEIIFQHRAKDKDTYPDLLDATVGGHVEIGSDYEESALKEMEEETGIKADRNDLHFIETVRNKAYDPVTNKTNNVIRAIYAYLYDGRTEDLKVEQGKAIGFEAWPLREIFNIPEDERKRFVPIILEENHLELFRKIQRLLGKESL